MNIFTRCLQRFVGYFAILTCLFLLSCANLQDRQAGVSSQLSQAVAGPALTPAPSGSDLAALIPDSLTSENQALAEDTCQTDDEYSEPELTVAEEVKQLEALGEWKEGAPAQVEIKEKITYDFPVTINRQVQFYINFYTTRERKTFTRWLERSTRYIPMIKAELRKAGLPEDLVYLPMIESGYSLTAYSRAKAVGPWQFIRSTGRLYGLQINTYVDERRDPIKSTKAAIDFLQDLHNQFDSWPLAVAAYNAGPGRVRQAIRRSKTKNFWKIAQGRYLKPETRLYVPKLIAAIIIAKEPEKYGFTNINYQAPLEFETIKVPRWTSLHAVAVAGDTDFKKLHTLNRQLRRAITPPGSAFYTLKVPPGKKQLIAKNLRRVNATIATRYKTHTVKRGETITRICRKYNLNKKTLLKANNLRSARLRPGQNLRIPYKTTTYKILANINVASRLGPAQVNPENLVLHKIRRGETMWDIAHKYNVPMHMIAAWNDIADLRRIRAGQQLALYLQDMKDEAAQLQTAQIIDTPKHRSPQVELRDKKKWAPQGNSEGTDNAKLTYHMVRGGESLWTIAQRYDVTTEKIKRWNDLGSNLIHPGRRLLLKISADSGPSIGRKTI